MEPIAVVCIAKNEADDIAEWIAYHLAIGVKTILVYDNASTDETRDVVLAFSEKYDVRLIRWNLSSQDYQRRAYEDAAKRLSWEVSWVAFIDADEFIASDDPYKLLKFLDDFRIDVSQVCLNWATFGSSGYLERPDALVIEAYRSRAGVNSGINRHVKSVVRPTHIRSCVNPHVFDVVGKTVDVHQNDIQWSEADGVGLIEGKPIYEVAWVNHYWTKSKAQWLKKISRGYHDIADDRRGERDLIAFDRDCLEEHISLAMVADKVKEILHSTLNYKPDQNLRQRLWRNSDPFAAVDVEDYALDLQGWGSKHDFLLDSIEIVRPTLIIEIGVWKGGSTISMAQKLRDCHLDASIVSVDTWRGAWDHWLSDEWFAEMNFASGSSRIYKIFLSNVKKLDLQDYVIPLPLDSINACVTLKALGVSADIIHIDAGHDYVAVTNDLTAWWELLRPGGIVIGDDYDTGGGWPEVRKAFDDFIATHQTSGFEYFGNKCRFIKK